MSREYFAHNFTIPMPLIESELKLHKKKEPFERIERFNGRYQCECLDGLVGPCYQPLEPNDLFSCENQCNVPICESDGRQHFGTDHCGLMPAMIVPHGTNPRDPHTPAAQVCKSVYCNPLIGDSHVCRFDSRQRTRTVKKDGKNVQVWCSTGSKCNPP